MFPEVEADFVEQHLDEVDGQAHYIIIAPFDTGYEDASGPLDRIAPGFIEKRSAA